MLKWAAKKLGVGAVEVHLDDLADYIESLASMRPEEKRLVAGEAQSFKQAFEAKGIEVGAPIDYVRKKPAMVSRLEEFVEETIKKDRIKALGMAAWMHTLRSAQHVVAGQRAEVFRELTRKMWRELLADRPEPGLAPIDFDPAKG